MDAHSPLESEGSWWSRPSGGREVLNIALPMVASTMSWTLMSFIDSAILYRVSAAAMSAAFMGGLTWFAVQSLLWGLCSYASTFVSQYYGDEQPEKIGPAVWQGVWLAILFTPLALAARPLAHHLFALHEPELASLETQFFKILCWATPGMLTAQALEAFYSGRGRTRVVMRVDASAVVVNLIFACVLVLGWGTGKSWGIAGAAWATVIAQTFRALLYATLALLPANRRKYNTLAGMAWNWPLMKRLFRYGGPSGIQMMLDILGFTAFVQLVGKLGLPEAEATSMAFRVSHVAFMPIWAFGIATAVQVGQRLGENKPDLASRATRTGFSIAIAYMGFISLLFVLAPGLFLQIFAGHGGTAAAKPTTPEEEEAVRTLAVHLLRFVAAYNMLDATAIVFVSALKGAGDTRFVMVVSSVSATTISVLTWLFVTKWGVGIYGCWALITGIVWALGTTYALRFRHGKWRQMRVIDQQHHPAPDVAGDLAPALAVD